MKANKNRLRIERLEDRLVPTLPVDLHIMHDQMRVDPQTGMTYEVYGPRIPWYFLNTDVATPQDGSRTPPLTNSFDGLDFNTTGFMDANGGYGAVPPDCTGAVGPNHVVSAVNSAIRWSDKTGGNARSRILGTDSTGNIAGAFFDMPGTANDPQTGLFDPRIVYDQYAGRFIVVAAELQTTIFGDPVNSSRLYIGVSQTSDPNGAWSTMRLDTKLNIGGTDTWLDYPALAIDGQAIYITGNFFSFDFQSNPGSRVIIMPKGLGTGGIYDPNGVSTGTFYNAASLSGTSDTVMIPAQMFGVAPANVGTFLVRYSGFNTGTIESISIIRINNPLSSPTFTHQFISSGDIDVTGPSIPDAGQLNGPVGIDTGDRRALNAVWRNNNLYMVSTVLPTSATPDVAQATAHWWRINTTTLTSLTIAEQGNISGNDIAADCPTYYGALAVDNAGNIGFGFGASTFTIYAGFYYTIHLATDAAGTVQASGTVAAGQDIYVRRYGGFDNRWGDYFAAALDPVDESFWVYGEYALPRGFTDVNGEQGIWGTRWGHFEVPNAGLKVTGIGPVSPNPRNSAFDTVQVTFSQTLNLATFTTADLTLTRNGTPITFSGNEVFTFVSGTTYQIAGLTQETGAAGTYVLSVNAATIQNGSNVAGAGVRSETWVMDLVGPIAIDVVDVSPDPISVPVATIFVQFNEAINLTTFTAADVTLTRNGNPVSFNGNETFTRDASSPLAIYAVSGLSEETAIGGTYVFSLLGAGVADPAGNTGSGTVSDTWVLQLNGPAVVDILDVAPDPRNTVVPFIDVVFSGPINLATFTVADIAFTRNGGPITFSGNEVFTFLSGSTYRVDNLTEETALAGNYSFTVIGTGIADGSGNAGTGSASDFWVMDLAGPTVNDVVDVAPDPRNTAVATIDVLFSEAINLPSFTVADLSLTLGGNPVSFSGNETFTLVSGTTYRVGGLSEETAAAGNYSFTVFGAGVADVLGNLGSGSASDAWTMDLTGPTVNDVVDIAPDPRNTAVGTVDVVFSELISLPSFTVADVSLTRNGNPVTFSGNETFTLVSGLTYRIGGLAEETAATGSYVITVNGSGILDPAGNAGTGSANDAWITDATAPTITSVGPVVPNPRNTVVPTITVVFSETINLATFTAADLALTRNGSPVSFSGNETFVLVSGSTYTVGGLSEETAVDGNYVFTVTGSGIQDLVGNAGTGSAATSWSADFTPPTVTDVVDIGPDPRNTPVTTVDVVFSETINLATFTAASLTLTRTGNPVTFSGNETFTLVSGTTYRVGGLTEETNADGVYTFVVSGSGIADLVGNFGTNSATDSFVIDVTPPTVLLVGPVSPDPRNTPVASITILFSETIILSTFSTADLTLTRNGTPVSFSGNETFTWISGGTYSIAGLSEETTPSGAYVLTVNATGVQDPLFNSGIGSASDSWTTTLAGDTTPPGVANVYWDSTLWSAAFRIAAGSVNGYPGQTGASQLLNLPWSNLNVVRIQFTENVVIDQGDLGVRGLNVSNYSFSGFSYDNVNFIASWTFQNPIGIDKLILDLDGDGAGAVIDTAGNPLAGSWNEGTGTFPTTGTPAQDFRYRTYVLIGDADRTGATISNSDVNAVRTHLFFNTTTAGFDIYRDIDGSGTVLNADVNAVRSNLFNGLPGGNPNRPVQGGRDRRAPSPRMSNPGSIDRSGTRPIVNFEVANSPTRRRLGTKLVRAVELLDMAFAVE